MWRPTICNLTPISIQCNFMKTVFQVVKLCGTKRIIYGSENDTFSPIIYGFMGFKYPM